MRQTKLFLCCVALVITAHTQAQIPASKLLVDTTGPVHPWSHLEMNNQPENFQFAVVTDRTGGHRPGVFEDAVRKLNLLQPEFVVSVGDLIEGYTRNVSQIEREWNEFNGFIDQLEMPFFYLPGNHDYTNEVMARIWEEKFGKSYYHFVYHDVLFLCLNSEEATKGSNMGGIEKPQFDYVKRVLEDHPDVRWTLVFMHQPLWVLDNTRYWKDVEQLLMDREHTVIVGHHHHYVKYERNNSRYIMLATTGGVSKLRGPNFGEFDHVAWITMTEDGPVLANLLLEGIWHEDVITEDMGHVINSTRIKVHPIFIEEPFKRGDFKIHLINDGNHPMTSILRFGQNRHFSPEIVELKKEVPPNSVEIVDLRVNAVGKPRTDRVQPLTLFTYHRHMIDDGREIELERQLGLVPVYKVMFNKVLGDVELDGDLGDWPALPFRGNLNSIIRNNSGEYTGDYDAHYEFNLLYDDDYLYLGLSVWDDELRVDSDESIWQQDGLQIHLDARPTLESANGTGKNRSQDYIYINFAPTLPRIGNGIPQINQPDNLPEGTRILTSKTNEGFSAEIAIPMEYVISKGGTDWESIRLNVGYYDIDDSNTRTAIWWRPEWSSQSNYIGSGMFFRSVSE